MTSDDDVRTSLFDRPDHHREASNGAERAVHAILCAEHGANAVTQRPMNLGTDIMWPAPTDWVQGVAAAALLEDHARQMKIGYALRARSEGRPWADLAPVLGVRKDSDDPGVAAFELVAPQVPNMAGQRYVTWRCESCGQRIRDTGPYSTHPGSDEHGHADGCARLARDVAAWRPWMDSDG